MAEGCCKQAALVASPASPSPTEPYRSKPHQERPTVAQLVTTTKLADFPAHSLFETLEF
jgi:hypothetical protein